MTTPKLADDTDWSRGRFYTWPATGREYASVTTILKAISKGEALTKWAAREAAVEAARLLDEAAAKNVNPTKNKAWLASIDPYWANIQDAKELGLPEPGYAAGYEPSWPDSFVRASKARPFKQRDDASALGDLVHKRVEAVILGQPQPPVPKELSGHMKQFDAWVAEWDVTFEFAEASVFNDQYGYAGTADIGAYLGKLQVKLPGPAGLKLCFIDIKTGKNVHAENALQLAGLMEGEWIGMDDGRTTHPVPQAAAGLVLHLRPRSRHTYLVKRDPALFAYFLHAMELKPFVDGARDKVLKEIHAT